MSDVRRLFLHVGMPKSGSTYLQGILANNRRALREQGFIYPYVQQEGMFHAAVEMSGRPEPWGLTSEQVDGTFDRLLGKGRRSGLDVVISHENFGNAGDAQIAEIATRVDDFETHLVLTVRDPIRMIAARWQERVKNGDPSSFAEVAEELLAKLPEDPVAQPTGYWPAQNLPWMLERWAPVAPPERMHVVITPAGGGDRDLLWRRFAEALGMDADAVDVGHARSNESLGAAQVAFLRQVILALDDRLPQPWYAEIVKRWFAQSVLSTVRSRKAVTPAWVAERMAGLATSWTAVVRDGSFQVHGDLAELFSAPAPADTPLPDEVTPEEVLEGLPDVVAAMLLRTRDLRVRIEELEERNRDLTREVEELREPPPTRGTRLRRRLLGEEGGRG